MSGSSPCFASRDTASPCFTRPSRVFSGTVGLPSGKETFPPAAMTLSFRASLKATHSLISSTNRAGSKSTFVRVEKSASTVNTFVVRSIWTPTFRPSTAQWESSARVWTRRSCNAATSGCFPHTPLLTQASPFAVCSH